MIMLMGAGQRNKERGGELGLSDTSPLPPPSGRREEGVRGAYPFGRIKS